MNGLNALAGGGGLSLVRILGTLSRTIGVVRQISPIYKDIKPLLSKAPLFFERLNNMRNAAVNLKNLSDTPLIQNTTNSEKNLPKTVNNSGPIFFQ